MGFSWAPCIAQRISNVIMRGVGLAWVDNYIIVGRTEDEFAANRKTFLGRIHKDKCNVVVDNESLDPVRSGETLGIEVDLEHKRFRMSEKWVEKIKKRGIPTKWTPRTFSKAMGGIIWCSHVTKRGLCMQPHLMSRVNWPVWQQRVKHTLRDYDPHAGPTENNAAIIVAFLALVHQKLKRPRGQYTRVKKRNLERQLATDDTVPYHGPAPGTPGAGPPAPAEQPVEPPMDADDTVEARALSAVESADNRAVRAASAKLSAGEPKAIRKAVRILDQDKCEINGSTEEVVAKMGTLHPHRLVNDDGSEIPFPSVPPGNHLCQDVQPCALVATIGNLCNLVAPGESGHTEELLEAACDDPDVAILVSAIATDIRNARVHWIAARALRRCRLIAAGKPGAGLCLRPIAIGECIVKVAATLSVYEVSDYLAKKFGSLQLGLVKLGCERVAHACQEALDKDPTTATMTIDATNAYNTCCRFVIANELYGDPKLS